MSIVTEFCATGALDSWLKTPNGRAAPLSDLVSIVVGVARGVAHLHAERLVHGDLAARNCLLNEDLIAKVYFRTLFLNLNYDFLLSLLNLLIYYLFIYFLQKKKVADFGMSRQMDALGDQKLASSTHDRLMPIKWLAPEVLQGSLLSFESDVYAFAVTVSETLSRSLPFPDLDAVSAANAVIEDDARPELPTDLPPQADGLIKLIHQCWKRDPADRPTMDDVCADLPELTNTLVSFRKDTQIPLTSIRLRRLTELRTISNGFLSSRSYDQISMPLEVC